jgi:hypothetical protein
MQCNGFPQNNEADLSKVDGKVGFLASIQYATAKPYATILSLAKLNNNVFSPTPEKLIFAFLSAPEISI